MNKNRSFFPKDNLLDKQWTILIKISLTATIALFLYSIYITFNVLINKVSYIYLPIIFLIFLGYLCYKYYFTLKSKNINNLGFILKYLTGLWAFFF